MTVQSDDDSMLTKLRKFSNPQVLNFRVHSKKRPTLAIFGLQSPIRRPSDGESKQLAIDVDNRFETIAVRSIVSRSKSN